jgi:hypothetical protein
MNDEIWGTNAPPEYEAGKDIPLPTNVPEEKYAILDTIRHGKYGKEQKLHAVMVYAVTGSVMEMSRQTGLPYDLVRDWKNKSQWWPDVMEEVRKELADELDGKLTGIMAKLTDHIIDRIENGDEIHTKEGLVRKKIDGKSLAVMLSIVYDKRAIARGDPTSRTERSTSEATLDKMIGRFEELAKTMGGKVLNDVPYKVEEEE